MGQPVPSPSPAPPAPSAPSSAFFPQDSNLQKLASPTLSASDNVSASLFPMRFKSLPVLLSHQTLSVGSFDTLSIQLMRSLKTHQ